MRNAVLVHGTGGSDRNYFWFADTRQYLESKGYKVWWPLLPHAEKPNLSETKNFLEQNLPEIGKETIFVGHSSACPLILHMMQHFEVRVKQVFLVSGFYRPLDDDGYSDLMLPGKFEWAKIKTKADEIILINSDNDPWGCTDSSARPIAINLGATLVVPTGQGHMGSVSFEQPYPELPVLKRLLRV
ncbi:MAG: hypothetical protein DLM55_01665 [Acidimicrobiales bacterium]|nr:MAG: hypothetical protein DLM55_01665 [Acidimicrobiales bacterium]